MTSLSDNGKPINHKNEQKEKRRLAMLDPVDEIDFGELFTAEELGKLLGNFVRKRKCFTEDDVYALFLRLETFKFRAELVQLAIDGEVDIDWSEEMQDVIFS